MMRQTYRTVFMRFTVRGPPQERAVAEQDFEGRGASLIPCPDV